MSADNSEASPPEEIALSGDGVYIDGEDAANADVEGREAPFLRSHDTYEQDHWETVHVERVDLLGAYESFSLREGPIAGREEIRIDLDGVGHPGASTHEPGDNVQCSVWLTPMTARKLGEELLDLANSGGEADA